MSSPVPASDIEAERPEKPREWRSRIVGQGEEDPEQLLANPRNWRIHPGYQQDALSEALDKIGWVQQIIVNTVTGHVVDGHLRVLTAQRKGESLVPVVYVELTPEEEHLALATLDPIAALAATDDGALKGLLADLEGDLDGQLKKMMGDLTKSYPPLQPSPTQSQIDTAQERLDGRFEEQGRGRMLDLTCPHCTEDFAICLDEFMDRRVSDQS